MSGLSISVFGFPDVQWAQQTVSFATRKAQGLLLYLAVEQSEQSRETLAALLWPEHDTVASKASLRQTLVLIKRALIEIDSTNAETLLMPTRTAVALNPTQVTFFDLTLIQRALHTIHSSTVSYAPNDDWEEELSTIHAAVQEYRGDFLAGFTLDDAPEFEMWVSMQREAWHQHMHELLAYLTTEYQTRGDVEQARQIARRWIAHDHWHEPAYRALMKAQWQTGDRAGALRTYETCRQVLVDELGITTESATDALAAQIREVTLSRLPHTLSPPRGGEGLLLSPPPPRPKVPPLVGRTEESATVKQLVQTASGRVVTIVGPPGVGKTHLADAVAEQMSASFDAGIWRVDLTLVHTADLVLETIAQTLGCGNPKQLTVLERLIRALEKQRVLLILDNFEQVLDAAVLLDTLVAHCPQLVVLITSRERLRLRREHCYSLQPLVTPPQEQEEDIPTVESSTAVQLFTQQLQKTQPDFKVDATNAAIIARLCRQLDGLPLALVLTASHSSVLPLETLLGRLEQSLPLPSTHLRDLPARHRSLQGVIEASYVLLNPTCQMVFRRLGVFTGGWTLEAAQIVVGADTLSTSLLDVLTILVEQHLVQVSTTNEQLRYDMLVTIRGYARAQLAAQGEYDITQQRYVHYIADLVEQVRIHQRKPQQHLWMSRIANEHDNIRGVLTWAIEHQELTTAIGVGTTLFWFWRGYIAEGLFWIKQILALPCDNAGLRSRALNYAGLLARVHGEYGYAQQCFEESLDICERFQLQRNRIIALHNYGVLLSQQGSLDRAAALMEEALQAMRQYDDEPWRIALLINNLGLVTMRQRNYQQAQMLLEEALMMDRAIGNPMGVEVALSNLGRTAIYQERMDDALQYIQESFQLAQELDVKEGLIFNLEDTALLCHRSELPEPATCLLGAVDYLRVAWGIPREPVSYQDYDQLLLDSQMALGEERFAQLWSEGQTMTDQATIAYAKEQLHKLQRVYSKRKIPCPSYP